MKFKHEEKMLVVDRVVDHVKGKDMNVNHKECGTVGKGALTASFVAGLLLMTAVSGCGDSDSASSGGTSPGGYVSQPPPSGMLAIKGLYMRQPGDAALQACKTITKGEKDLVVVDFRKGIEREKDEATKAADKKEYDNLVKKAHSDVDKFLRWNNYASYFDPKKKEDKYEARDEDGRDATIPALMLAGIHGYQAECMLVGEKPAEGGEPTLFTGELCLPDNGCLLLRYWQENVRNTEGVLAKLHEKGLRYSEQDNEVFFRLTLKDEKGNAVEKSKVATEYLLANQEEFEKFKTKEDKLAAAESAISPWFDWVKFNADLKCAYVGSVIKSSQQLEKEAQDEENRINEALKSLDDEEALARKQLKELDTERNQVRQKYEKLIYRAGGKNQEQSKLKKKMNLELSKIGARQETINKKAAPLYEKRRSLHKEKNDLLLGRNKNKRNELRTGSYYSFSTLAQSCNLVVEWATFTVAAEKLVEVTFPIANPGRTAKDARDVCADLVWTYNPVDGKERKRVFFEMNLVDPRSPLWFRLCLKTTNGVEVAKSDVVNNWLAVSGHFPPSDKVKIPPKNMIEIAFRNDATREDKLEGICFVHLDNEGNVKEVYINEKGMARLFDAGDVPAEKFAGLLLKNYPDIGDLEADIKNEDPGRGLIRTYTWTHDDPAGYKICLFERAYFNNDGVKYNDAMLKRDVEVGMALGLAGKLPMKYLSITATKPESERKFD